MHYLRLLPPIQEFTRRLGKRWIELPDAPPDPRRGHIQPSAVLGVPSVVIPAERNYILNPTHPQFGEIEFSASEPFLFDPRLKKQSA
jgi:RES domain-containing protein